MSKILKVVLATNVGGTFVFQTGSTVQGKMNDAGPTTVSLPETPAASGIYQASVSDEGIYNIWVDGVDSGLTVRAGTLNGDDIQDLVIDTGHLVAECVTNAKIAADAVDTAQIADGAVDTDQLAADAVTLSKMADDSVDTDQLVNGAVTLNKLAANSVNGAKIVGSGVVEANIAAGAVTENKIGDAEITLAKLNTNAYSNSTTANALVQRTDDGTVIGANVKGVEGVICGDSTVGLITRKRQTVVSGALAGLAQIDVTFDEVSAGDKILGILIRTNAATGQAWSAAWLAVPSSQVICSGESASINTKVNKMYDDNADSALCSGNAVVRLTADSMTWGNGTFTCVVFYETLTDMADYA